MQEILSSQSSTCSEPSQKDQWIPDSKTRGVRKEAKASLALKARARGSRSSISTKSPLTFGQGFDKPPTCPVLSRSVLCTMVSKELAWETPWLVTVLAFIRSYFHNHSQPSCLQSKLALQPLVYPKAD
ncbi:WRKY family transcription factor family protein [Striga asiatica]|uniref:WRKY family transcription factor family protein n=1 Tax=Striga asiatica TaxID=4170 RepID=A0A5A7QS23_STRAF|nr:WRKY family transcription factor family protein [Striga asiatica]